MHMRKATCSLDLRRATPQAVVDSGALDSLVTCLEEFDPGVKVRGPGAGEKARDMRGAVLGLHNAW